MPFDEEDPKPSAHAQKIGLKKVSSQKSIFETMPKKPTPEQFQEQVKEVQERKSGYNARVADLAIKFNKAMSDKTLSINKNMLQQEVEKEIITGMARLAQEVNADPNEREGEGSLSWIILLLKTCFNRRDKINNIEYQLALLEKKFVSLDKSVKSE